MRALLFITLTMTWWIHPLVWVVGIGYALWVRWPYELLVLTALIDLWLGIPAGQTLPWLTLTVAGILWLKELVVPRLARQLGAEV